MKLPRCVHCQKPFRSKNPQKIYCSRECAMHAHIIRASNGTRPDPKACAVCKSTFIPSRPHARYCSEGCRYEVAKERQRIYERRKGWKKIRFKF